MRRSVRGVSALAGSGLVLSLLLGAGVRAQDPVPDPCVIVDLTFLPDGTCVVSTVPTSEVPLPPGPWGETPWNTLTDAVGDVRNAAGDVVERPQIDISQVWWRVGRLPSPLVRTLDGAGAIVANDTDLNTRTPYIQIVVEVAGDTIGDEPEQETLLVGVATDRDGKPANDSAGTVATPFHPWTGADTIHQAGQFSNGSFGAGTTRLNGQGEFIRFYNAPSGIWFDPVADRRAYTLLVPTRGSGDEIRIFTQGTEGETQLFDIAGSPFTANGTLPRGGVFKAGPGCLELSQTPVIGEGDPAALAQVRIGGLSSDTPLLLDLDLIQGRQRSDLVVSGAADGDGIAFEIPLPSTREGRLGDIGLFADDDGDGAVDEGAEPILSGAAFDVLNEPFELTGRSGFGHLLGGYNCARTDLWRSTADVCLDPASIQAQLADAATAEPTGDDGIAGCVYRAADGTPLASVTIPRLVVTLDDARTIFVPNLEREGCEVAEDPVEGFELVAVRECGGDQPSTSVFSLDDGMAVLTQIHARGPWRTS